MDFSYYLFWSVLIPLILLLGWLGCCRWVIKYKKQPKTIGFFHPYCNQAGGGERVLWTCIKAIKSLSPEYTFIIYSGEPVPSKDILLKAHYTFGIDLQNLHIEFVTLRTVKLLDASTYRFMTILFQVLGSNVVIIEALLRRPCEVILDTHGHPFTYWFIYLIGGIKVIPYVHYPVLSTDMIQRVRERRPTYNNSERIAEYISVSKIKLVYYAVLMNVYKLMGRCVEIAMCNSTWTKNHISNIWNGNVMVVYPPCDVEPFLKLSMIKNKEYKVISIGQFRPEKDHFLQIEAMNTFIKSHPEFSHAKLLLVGSCRNQQDEALVASLKSKIAEYNLEDNVEFHLNLKFPDLLNLLEISHIGIHTMWNEHFGIGVIEMMAAGLVTIAHNSGGPREDIIQMGNNGFLATTPNEYASLIYTILSNFEKYEYLRTNARESSKRYDESIFMNQFREVLYGVLGR